MTASDLPNIGWRGRVRLLLLRLTRDPVLTSRVNRTEQRLNRVEELLARLSHEKMLAADDVTAPPVHVDDAGRMQKLEQKLEALQTRVDVLTLALANFQAEIPSTLRQAKDTP